MSKLTLPPAAMAFPIVIVLPDELDASRGYSYERHGEA